MVGVSVGCFAQTLTERGRRSAVEMELQWTTGGIYRPVRNEHQGKAVFHTMNHTATINVWKQTNRVSRLWEELAEIYVAPDPRSKEGIAPGVAREPEPPIHPAPVSDTGLLYTLEPGPSLFPGVWEEIQAEEKPFIERVGRESIHLVKHALEALTAPSDEAPLEDPEQEMGLGELGAASEEVEKTRIEALPAQASLDPYPAMIKVAFEPEPHFSIIETRRAVYGLKIPARPLHKRPVYQRVFFCLRIWFRKASGKSDIP